MAGAVSLLAAMVDKPAGHLRASSAVAFAAGGLFGVPGILGVALGGLLPLLAVPLLAVQVPPYHPIVLSAATNLVVAAIAWLVMRFGGGVGRFLADLPSYAAACGAGVFAALLSAPLLAAAAPQPTYAVALGVSATAGLAGVILAGLPLLLVGAFAVPGLTAPIPGERRGGPLVDLVREREPAPVSEVPPTDIEATLFATASTPARPQRGLFAGMAVLGGVALVAVPVSVWTEADHWISLLYLAPVVWGARRFGLRGGVLAASLSGIVHLLGTGLVDLALAAEAYHPLSLYAQFLLLSPVGAYLGWAREREVELRRELASRYRLLRQDLLRVVRALTSAVEAKDAYTEAHLRRVAEYAVAVGARLGVKGRDLETLYHAAMLHDVGKLGVPESVLRKRGPLDHDEVEAMRQHPEIGARIVERLDLLADAAPIILHHQERFDGGDGTYPGYPAGIAGDEIPLGSRIIAVVDAYDAMTSDRPYRGAKEAAEALAELRREAGRQFDPLVVEVFADVLVERPWEG